ncbi:imidazole glycerol phosphate synthase subunit HisH [Leptospira paudalimensis]|uniref:imidazole glycerol phosphate synthase subunit HisH n=1 Tax=Leptospira paudalimensis TaxID=2950024 RepID=UPI00223E6293|nr:imidazole glycerol phosphate synthase subunit HisH [Leptospira paudalimensis]
MLDYEVGNHASVKACLDKLGFIVQITSDVSEIKVCDLLIMPGVGAFPVAIQSLVKKKLNHFLKEWVLDGRPLFGICLGMQLFANSSTEIEFHEGLGFIQGNVTQLSQQNDFHIGWNQLSIREANSFLSEFDGLDFYFNHSFAYESDGDLSPATTKYVREFPSIVKHGQVIGVQFHPEKSQNVGKEFFSKIVKELVNGF